MDSETCYRWTKSTTFITGGDKMKIFRMNDKYSIVCETHNTSYGGFKHTATLMQNGLEITDTKICYHNRTWESYQYQSVLLQLLDKTNVLTDKEKRRFRNKVK